MIVVTLTSWIKRIDNVISVLRALKSQTRVPDRIYLNLSKEEFKNTKLPAELTLYIKNNPIVTLNWVEGPDIKPFKKIFPILKFLNDEDIILAVDDDSRPKVDFIESRLKDFKVFNTCISGVPTNLNGYANGLLPEIQHRVGPGTLYQAKMLKHWDELLNEDIIKTNHDDAFYNFLLYLNGYLTVNCTQCPTGEFPQIEKYSPALHGSIGCASAIEATRINIQRFKEVFGTYPTLNYFKTNSTFKNPISTSKVKMVVFDRVRKAGDNAEYFYRWIKENHPEISINYILNAESADWDRLAKEGFDLIDSRDTEKVQVKIDEATHVAFSYFPINVLPNITIKKAVRVFLNHGVFYRVLKYLKTKLDQFDLMLAGNILEYNTLKFKYKIPENKIALVGQPRHDNLVNLYKDYEGSKNNVLIQFWWRPWLNTTTFGYSLFYSQVSKLLSDSRLKELSQKYNVNFLLKLHCEMENYRSWFTRFSNVTLVSNDELFASLFVKSSLIVTDISSNVYDMGTINKPCIYFRPDWFEMKLALIKKDGDYLDTEEKGIGPTTDSIDTFFELLEEALKNDFKVEKKYENLRKDQILFREDNHCCWRAFEVMLRTKRYRFDSYRSPVDTNFKKEAHLTLPKYSKVQYYWNR